MSDLFEAPDPPGNAHEFSVSEISAAVKKLIEDEFGFVRVRGEVGRVMHARSGHLYFDLKDDRAVISAVSWRGQAARLAVKPEEGMEVVATGRLTTFPGQSRYQLVVEALEPAGTGALMAMLEKRRKALEAEGLFAADRKKPLPWLPETIGVVTSPSGAVIRDILHRLRDRFPRHVLIWPVAVQGQNCAPEVARAIRGFNALSEGGPIARPDLIIVARGGGSVEDLWGFNDEAVVRAAAASEIPLISAVGHETDTTLIDHAADVRAPTPTAAAELAVPVRLELISRVRELDGRLARALTQSAAQRRLRLGDLARGLPRADRLTETARQRLDRAGDRLPAALTGVVQRGRVRLAASAGAIRPEAAARRVRETHRAFAALEGRLQAGLLVRGVQRRRQDFGSLMQRLGTHAKNQSTAWRRRLDALERMRQTLGYRETLKRGFAVVWGDGAVVTTRKVAAAAQALEVEFSDGRLSVGGTGGRARSPARRDDDEQGSLF